jgi:hypothetical protein
MVVVISFEWSRSEVPEASEKRRAEEIDYGPIKGLNRLGPNYMYNFHVAISWEKSSRRN